MFTEAEIEKSLELSRKGIYKKMSPRTLRAGDFVWAREKPANAVEIQDSIYLLTTSPDGDLALVWMPTFDDLIALCHQHKILFAQLTDFLHRRRMTDGREREGIYQMLLEHFR